MSIRQLPSPRWTIPGNGGAIAAGYYVYFYQPGTSTPKNTYTDYTGTVANTNPVILDSRGEANIWADGTYKVAAYTGDMTAGGVLVWTQDNYGEGTTSVLQGNFNLVLNGSFEQDTNGDGVPDDWTVTAYTGGTVVLDAADQIHGAQSLKFTSVGTGGGFADTAFFEVEGSKVLPVSFAIKASIATVHNQVDVVWYTAAKAVISTTTLYSDSTTNPTTWTDFYYLTNVPATARHAKVRIYGCKDDVAQAGSSWFDNILSAESGSFQAIENGVTGYINGQTVFIEGNYGGLSTPLYTTMPPSSPESVGPTGSGATRIWTALDSLPSNTTAVILKVFMDIQGSAVGVGTSWATNTLYGMKNGAVSGGTYSRIAYTSFWFTAAAAGHTGYGSDLSTHSVIPVDSSRIFQLQAVSGSLNNTIASTTLSIALVGFVV